MRPQAALLRTAETSWVCTSKTKIAFLAPRRGSLGRPFAERVRTVLNESQRAAVVAAATHDGFVLIKGSARPRESDFIHFEPCDGFPLLGYWATVNHLPPSKQPLVVRIRNGRCWHMLIWPMKTRSLRRGTVDLTTTR